MKDGAVKVPGAETGSGQDEWWLYNNGERLAKWGRNKFEGEVTGKGAQNGYYKIEIDDGGLKLIDDPNGGSYNVYKLSKYKETAPVDGMYGMELQKYTQYYDTWGIAEETFSEGQNGRWYIGKYQQGVVTEVEPTESLARVIAEDGNQSAQVKLLTYAKAGEPTAYRWSFDGGDRGNNYNVGDKVTIAGTGVDTTVIEIIPPGGVGDVPDPDPAGYEEFIAKGNNYSPLNAICDYFINNTDRSSHENNPEHSVIFCNEIIYQDEGPKYKDLAMAGLKLLNAKEWTSFNTISAYFKRGIQVERLFVGAGDRSPATDRIGPTNLFPEIAYFLLTDEKYGAGRHIGLASVDKNAMETAARFCFANGYFWDGVITESQNLRNFIFENAAYMMLDFTIKGGQFALYPSVPFNTTTYRIERDVLPEVKALFTDGNMRNMEVSFLTPEERQLFKAVALYRRETDNGFPETETVAIRMSDAEGGRDSDPVEEFDLTGFCTRKQHALDFLKYALMLRRYVDHSIKFETTPQSAMNMEPGDYFRVASRASHIERFSSGSIDFAGFIQSPERYYPNSSTEVVYWRPDPNEDGAPFGNVKRTTLTTDADGVCNNRALHGTVFCRVSDAPTTRIYKCESLTYSDDGLVEVAASVNPLTDDGKLQVLKWDDKFFYFYDEES